MQVSVRFLTSSYESRQAGTLILDDDGTHPHHLEPRVIGFVGHCDQQQC